MVERTVSFPVSQLGGIIDKKDIYGRLYEALNETLNEDDIEGIQAYPAKWPRKVQITLKTKEVIKRQVIGGRNRLIWKTH